MPTPNANDGVLISDTWAELVPAPTSGTRVVTLATIFNADTAPVRLSVAIFNAEANARRFILEVALASDDSCAPVSDGERLVLRPNRSLQAVLAGPTTTRQPDFTVSWEEWA